MATAASAPSHRDVRPPAGTAASARFVVVTPARNEAAYLGGLVASMTAQTCRPEAWLIVDDGSTDDTGRIAESAAREHPWIRVVRRGDRGARAVGTGAVDAFDAAMAALGPTDCDFLCLFDADVTFGPEYFETLFGHFAADPSLGIACGQVYEREGDALVPIRQQPEMTFGAAKCWRRACFDAIGGLVHAVSWDGIDSYRAMMRGWRTRTIDVPELTVLHHRRMGSSDRSVFHGWARRGAGMYFVGAHPAWVLASAVFNARSRPFVLCGAAILWGFARASLQRAARYEDAEFRRFLRGMQLRKLRAAAGLR